MKLVTIFVLISCIVFTLVAYLIPKKMKPYETYATSLFAALFGLFIDCILALKYKFYVLDEPGIQIPPLIGQVVLYSTTSAILLNLFPYEKSLKSKVIYILGFTLLTVAYEFVCYKVGFIKYHEWKIWYSALSYPFFIAFLIWHYQFFQRMVKKNSTF